MTERDEDLSRPAPLVVDLDGRTFLLVVVGVLAAFAVAAVARLAPEVLTQVAVGTLLALALDPLVLGVRRWRSCGRSVAVAVVGAGLVGALTLVVLVLGPPAVDQASELVTELPATVESFYDFPVVGDQLRDGDAVGVVERFVDDLPGRLDDATVAGAVERVVGNVRTVATVLVVSLALMLDGDALVGRARRLLRPARRGAADVVGRIVYRTVGNYFAGSVLVALINGLVILSVGLALGVPLAPLAGVWAALTNLIPQIGGLLGGSFLVVLALSEGPVTGLIALVVFLVYQQVENNIVQPAVVGVAVDLSPPATMLAALVGGAAAGVPGALAATPLLGAAKALYRNARGVPIDELLQPRTARLPAPLRRLLRRGGDRAPEAGPPPRRSRRRRTARFRPGRRPGGRRRRSS
jgi:predicted PurR-regulated permease PerM